MIRNRSAQSQTQTALSLSIPMPVETCALALQNLDAGKNFVHRTKLNWANPTNCNYEIKYKLISRGFPGNVGNSTLRGVLTYEDGYQITRVTGHVHLSLVNLSLAVMMGAFGVVCILAGMVYVLRLNTETVWIDIQLFILFLAGVLLSYREVRKEHLKVCRSFLDVVERTLKATIPAEPT